MVGLPDSTYLISPAPSIHMSKTQQLGTDQTHTICLVLVLVLVPWPSRLASL